MSTFCSNNGLKIGNTFFKHKDIHKKTWLSPDGNTLNEIDYICVNKKWGTSLMDVKVHRGADVGSDHYLLVGKIRIKLKRKTKKERVLAYAVEKLKEPSTAEWFRLELANRFDVLRLDLSIEDQLESFSSGVKVSAETVLGRRRGTNKERWISSRTWNLIDKRKEAKIKRDQARTRGRQQAESSVYRDLDKEVKKSCKLDKKDWIKKVL